MKPDKIIEEFTLPKEVFINNTYILKVQRINHIDKNKIIWKAQRTEYATLNGKCTWIQSIGNYYTIESTKIFDDLYTIYLREKKLEKILKN